MVKGKKQLGEGEVSKRVAFTYTFISFISQLTLLRRSAHRDARTSWTYSKINMAPCALSCLPDDISEQYLEWQLASEEEANGRFI